MNFQAPLQGQYSPRTAILAMLVAGWCAHADAGLTFTVGESGLASLAYEDRPLLASGRAGAVRPIGQTPKLQGKDGPFVAPQEKPQTTLSANGRGLQQRYSWGLVECSYTHDGERLNLTLRVTNTSADLIVQALDLEILELTFPSIPQGRVLEAGMWGSGGNLRPLYQIPMVAGADQMPPAVFVQFEEGALAFASDDDPGAADRATVSVPFTTNPSTKLAYPLVVSFPAIAAGRTVTSRVSLRFAGAGAGAEELAGDVLQRYRDAFPYVVSWPDRRSIGALFLATSQQHPQKNPRGWFGNAADVDLTTPAGLAKWRARLMKYADDSIAVLKDLDAQGMITWDLEGEEFAGATFYGDPRLAARLAPETQLANAAGLGALDEYFAKFRQAGLRTGLTLRPQGIEFKAGVPVQQLVPDPRQELLDKIEYAMNRWGCTIFYVDSTYDANGSLSADVFAAINELHPDILLLPENENLRDYAYSAPLNSYTHAGITSTPASVREVYDQAFSALLVTTTEEKMREGRAALLEAVRRGDILIVNAWYAGKQIDFVKGIYEDASR